jgi:hypothetical protein
MAALSEKMARVALGLALVGVSASASASNDVWATAPSASGVFNVDTPCSASELAAGKQAPDNMIAGVTFVPESRVFCQKAGLMFVAGEIEVNDIPAGSTLFDLFLTQAKNDNTAEGTPSQIMIGGKRAFLNREARSDVLAQTGLVELGRTKLLFLLAGADSTGRPNIQKQGEAVARFYASIKVTGK